jgi:hypothetical protein
VNCGLAGRLIDDYQDNELGPRQRTAVEAHVSACPRCAEQLRARRKLDRDLNHALAVEVLHRYPSFTTGAQTVTAAQAGLRLAIWTNHVASAMRLMATLVAIALVAVGLYSLATHLHLSTDLDPITLSPVRQLLLARPRALDAVPLRELDRGDPQPFASSPQEPVAPLLFLSGISLEPKPLGPGGSFTLKMLLHNDTPGVVRAMRLDLEISGPTGYFRFPVVMQGPFPGRAISTIWVTPSTLAATCQERYRIAPTDIFGVAGTYQMHLTLYNPSTMEP